MIHPCRWKHNLASKRPDQLCQAVIRPRVVKPVQVSTYCSSFQMFQQNGTFNGLETASHTSFGHFDSTSKLSTEAEARSIANRSDINAHLTKIRVEKVISEYVETSKRDFAKEFSETIDYDLYYKGGTFVSLEASMVMQRETRSRMRKVLIDDNETERVHTQSFPKVWSAALYPCQNMTSHGVICPKVPNLYSSKTNTQLSWTICGLISRVELLWKLVEKVDLKTSLWHGWFMVYLNKHCFDKGGRRQGQKDPFKYQFVSPVEKINGKLNRPTLISAFEEISHVQVYDNEDNISLQDLLIEEENIADIKVVIASFTDIEFPFSMTVNDCTFELQTIIDIEHITDIKWDGTIHSKHYGTQFESWWSQKRNDPYPIQVGDIPDVFLEYRHIFTVAYVQTINPEIEQLRNEVFKNLGGQSHVQYNEHRLPLITSTERSNKCKFRKKEYYRCCEFECKVYLCKKCFEDCDETISTFISLYDEELGVMNDDHDEEEVFIEEEHVEEDGDHLLNEVDDEDDLQLLVNENVNGDNNILDREQFGDYLTSTADEDIPLLTNDVDDNEGNNFLDYVESFPTTNAGELAYEVDQQTEYGGTLRDIVVGGATFLNQCGTYLTRKTHQIKGSSRHNYFLQRICATTVGESIPIMYPEGILFPSIHWKMAIDNCSIVGAILAPLLTESVSQFGFASITLCEFG